MIRQHSGRCLEESYPVPEIKLIFRNCDDIAHLKSEGFRSSQAQDITRGMVQSSCEGMELDQISSISARRPAVVELGRRSG
jgi:hypothetical protein